MYKTRYFFFVMNLFVSNFFENFFTIQPIMNSTSFHRTDECIEEYSSTGVVENHQTFFF